MKTPGYCNTLFLMVIYFGILLMAFDFNKFWETVLCVFEKKKIYTVKTLNIGTPRPATPVVLNLKQFNFTMKKCLQKM